MKNDQIEIYKVTETRSTAGGVTETWGLFLTLWAEVDQVSGNENFNADMMVYNDVKSFAVYYNNGQKITPKMRIRYRDDNYNITSISHKNRLETVLIAARQDDE
jgi:SPP1 family predicted phage head-tail adaptor